MRNVLLFLAMAACAGKDWREAVKADTSRAYATYAARHRGEPKAEVAARRAEERAWAEAQAADTSVAYGSYVSAFPAGPHAAEARQRGDELAWTEAKAAGTLGALSAYTARYPSSPHVAEAEQLVEKLWYEDAKKGASEASWGRYVVRYPKGLWAEEAKRERERIAWDATVALGSRQAYVSFLERYPDGTHAADARGFVAATRVGTLQPVVVLVSTWQPDGARSTVISRVRAEYERGLLTDMKRWFKVLPTKTQDAHGQPPAHPQETWGATPGVGLLVLEYSESAGRTFEPSGHATDNSATIRLYAPNSKLPVFERSVTGSTPKKIYGTDASALHTSAVKELGNQLRSTGPEIETNRATPAPR